LQILSINIISERVSGAYRRILVSPASMLSYIFGKSISFVAINIAQAVVMFSIGIFVLPLLGCPELGIRNPGAIVLITVCVSLVSISFGLMMAAVCRSVQAKHRKPMHSNESVPGCLNDQRRVRRPHPRRQMPGEAFRPYVPAGGNDRSCTGR